MVQQAERHMADLDRQRPTEIDVFNPVTGKVIGTVPNHTPEHVAEVAANARKAQAKWAATPVKQRADIMRRFADLIMGDRHEHMVKVIREENGKNRGSAFGEISVVALAADYYARNAAKWLKPERRTSILRGLYGAQVFYKPHGLVGNISPWNYPLNLTMIDMIPALVAGNAVIAKPSEITPFTALEGAKILYEAGLPEDVFQIVTGYGDTGSALIDEVDFIMFTGSTATGRKVAAQAAERLIPYSLELGGNDAMIVLKDADLEKAAASAVSAGLENAGQLCVSIERVIVEEPIYEEFVKHAHRWASQVVLGTGDGYDTHMGSMTNEREIERVQEHIDDALAKGGRLVIGGNRREDLGPLFFEPTIIADATQEMVMMQEETFGPLIAITKASNIQEAVEIANSTQYGLSGSVWGGDVSQAIHVGLQMDIGDVSINSALLGQGKVDVPIGGQRNSGVGRRNGRKHGLLKYTAPQGVIVDRFPALPEAPTVYTDKIVNLLKMVRKVKKYLPFIGS